MPPIDPKKTFEIESPAAHASGGKFHHWLPNVAAARIKRTNVRFVPALLVAVILSLPLALANLPPGVPPDGPAGQETGLGLINAGKLARGTNVTTPLVEVVNVSCPECDSATAAADFTVSDANGTTVRVHESHSWQSTYNVKKQLFVPVVGMHVVVQGRIENDSSGSFINAKRWAEKEHTGVTATISDLFLGKIPTGTYVWIPGAKIGNVARWNDGDYSFDLTDGTGGNLFVHAELGPPFWSQLRIPHINETVDPYGMVRYDPDHKWWELHPIRCWSPAECVPLSVAYVRNGPTPGTPPTGGNYLEGTPLSEEGNATLSEEAARIVFAPLVINGTLLAVDVNASRLVHSVEVSIANGTWEPMMQNGMTWTRNVSSTDAEFVRFRATFTEGTGATSGLFSLRNVPHEIADVPEPRHPLEDPGTTGNESSSAGNPAASSTPTPSTLPPTVQENTRATPGAGAVSVFAAFALVSFKRRALR